MSASRGPAHALRPAWALRVWIRRSARMLAVSGGGAVVVIAAVVAMISSALTASPNADPAPPETTPPAIVEAPSTLAAGALQDPSRSAQFSSTTDAAATRILIPSIGLDSVLESLGTGPSGELLAPADFAKAGWFAAGVVPGDIGPATIAGHVDSETGPAVFHRIGELAPGAEITVERSDGVAVRFVVTGTAQSTKAAFPTGEVYGPVPTPELRLITCAGPFDRASGHYLDNLVVFATLA